ncbi:hypothetical protein SUNI508_06950 [Seiridium unicorne]|uniref:Uncharacterized protein n=1 Tax=Seiridium unicorne TaxID=138068 RepID=A0ABR2UZ29_9PEZI
MSTAESAVQGSRFVLLSDSGSEPVKLCGKGEAQH